MNAQTASVSQQSPTTQSTKSSVVGIRNLVVKYHGRGWKQAPTLAVNCLNLEVQQGEVFGFLGPNGAGKTSTMQVLLGFNSPTSGAAYLFDIDVREAIARQRIGYL